jgi:hypothetical protein
VEPYLLPSACFLLTPLRDELQDFFCSFFVLQPWALSEAVGGLRREAEVEQVRHAEVISLEAVVHDGAKVKASASGKSFTPSQVLESLRSSLADCPRLTRRGGMADH